MDLEVIVSMILPLASGESARGEWKKQDVVFDLPGEFSRKLCVGFWNDKAMDAASLRAGDRVALSVNIESREYQGRWYTEVRAWRMNRLEGGAQAGAPMGQQPQAAAAGFQQAQPQTEASSAVAAEKVDDLPF